VLLVLLVSEQQALLDIPVLPVLMVEIQQVLQVQVVLLLNQIMV
jgi:hypothetical protein